MRDNKWYSGLAFGLVGGLVISALLFAWLSGGLPGWWKHDGTLVTSKDTLANWLVAIFSFIAALFLWLTLRATQEMAKDTRRIGEAQVRAYLDVKLVRIEAGEIGKSFWTFQISVANRGQSPASQVYVQVKVGERESLSTVFPDLGSGDDCEGGVVVLDLPDDAFIRPKRVPYKSLGVCVTVRFLDVFSENYMERVDRREFSIDRIGEGGEAFRIRYSGDSVAKFKRMEQTIKT
jgi:hypothetical protein